MATFAVITAIGPDRPGLVNEISAFLADRNINIEDSRMAVLGGEFAVILLASGAEGIISSLKNEITGIEKTTGLSFQIKPTIAPAKRKISPSIPHRLTVTGMDHPGIVNEITRVLHSHLINIESLDTHISYAPISGSQIFNMKCTVNIPAEQKISGIRKELMKLGDLLNIDIDIVAAESL